MGAYGAGKTPDMNQATPSFLDMQNASMADNYWDTTQNTRQNIIKSYEDLYGGNTDVMDMPQFQGIDEGLNAAYNLARPQIEDQYGVAKENILANTPRGGAQGNALSNLEQNRAENVSGLGQKIASQRASAIQGIIQDMINKSYGMATGAPQVAAAGMGAAAGNLAANQNALINQQTALQQQMNGIYQNPKGKSK